MVPDDALGVGVQPASQLPPHVSAALARRAYEPAAQLVQVETPATAYVPLGHREHVADDVSQNMGQSQLVQTEAAVPENLPAAQAEQVLAPTESENLPAAQAVHLGATLHSAVKPVSTQALLEPNTILREPVVDV
jgi:hypothetical protein